MKIETKYNIGDEVWFKGYKEIFSDKIYNIRITIDCLGEIEVLYELWNDAVKSERNLYRTKQELLDSL